MVDQGNLIDYKRYRLNNLQLSAAMFFIWTLADLRIFHSQCQHPADDECGWRLGSRISRPDGIQQGIDSVEFSAHAVIDAVGGRQLQRTVIKRGLGG